MSVNPGQRRWQYLYVWRYGPLVLLVLGLLMILDAMLADRPDAVLVTLLTLGVISVITGVVLPRAEGDFRATSTGVAGSLVKVTELDVEVNDFAVSGRAIAAAPSDAQVGAQEPISIGDVWEKLLVNGFEVVEGMAGSRALEDEQGRGVVLPAVDLAGSSAASPELLRTLRAWGIQPSATGRYTSTEWRQYERGSGTRPTWFSHLLSRGDGDHRGSP